MRDQRSTLLASGQVGGSDSGFDPVYTTGQGDSKMQLSGDSKLGYEEDKVGVNSAYSIQQQAGDEVGMAEEAGQLGDVLKVSIVGTSFVYAQIRLMIGAALAVADGVLPPEVVLAALDERVKVR